MSPLRIGIAFSTEILAALAPESSPDIVVFPEIVDGGYASLAAGAPPHTIDDPTVRRFRDASRRMNGTIIAGSMLLDSGASKGHNSSLVFQRGRLHHRYDKIHLFGPTGDKRFFIRGSAASPFTLSTPAGKVKAGVILCYDLRFPELIRLLALEGMQILFVPARWPAARNLAWQTLLRARAIENQIFVVGVNARDKEGGASYAYDPMGNELLNTNTAVPDALTVVTIDLGVLAQARTLHDNIKEALVLRKGLVARPLPRDPALSRTTKRRR